jgi:hypothetical protein
MALNQVSPTFRPNMAFKIGLAASEKRGMIRFHKFRRYRERQGKRVYYYDPFFSVEINSLRSTIDTLLGWIRNNGPWDAA